MSVVNLQFEIFNFQFAILLLQRRVLLPTKLLQIENCKMQIDGLRAKPALDQGHESRSGFECVDRRQPAKADLPLVCLPFRLVHGRRSLASVCAPAIGRSLGGHSVKEHPDVRFFPEHARQKRPDSQLKRDERCAVSS